jgi:hypothetical protein
MSIRLRAALAALALVALPAAASTTTVYKCFDRNLNVLYTDQPCRGEQLEIDAGRADPAAVAELAREREALSRAVAARIADLRRPPVPSPTYVAGPPLEAGQTYYPAWFPAGYAAAPDVRGPRRGNGGGRPPPRAAGTVPAPAPNGIVNRTFR